MQRKQKKRFSSEKLLFKLISNTYESDSSLSRKVKFRPFVETLLFHKSEKTRLFYQLGSKLKDKDLIYTLTEHTAKNSILEIKQTKESYQPLNHKVLFTSLEEYLDLVSSTLEGEKKREERDKEICCLLEYDEYLSSLIINYITCIQRYSLLKKIKFSKYFSRLFSSKKKRKNTKEYVNQVFQLLHSTAIILEDIEKKIDFDRIGLKFIKFEIIAKLNSVLDTIPSRWKNESIDFLTQTKQSWGVLKVNFAHLYLYTKNILLGLSLVNNEVELREIVRSMEIPEIYKKTAIQVSTKEIDVKKLEFAEYCKETLQQDKVMLIKKEGEKVEVNGLNCILKDFIRCDIHHSRVHFHASGFICVLLSRIIHLSYIDLVKEMIEEYLFLIANNVTFPNSLKPKSVGFNAQNELVSKYEKTSLLELLCSHLDHLDSEVEGKLRDLIKQLLRDYEEVNLNILISCLFTLKRQEISLMKSRSLKYKKDMTLEEILQIKILKKLTEIHKNKSLMTINKIYVCIVIHCCINNGNVRLFNKVLTKYSNTFNFTNLVNIVISNTLKKDQNQTDFIKLQTIDKLHHFQQNYDYLKLLKPKVKVKFVDFLINIETHQTNITNFLLDNNLKTYFVEQIESNDDTKFTLFLRFLSNEEFEVLELFRIEVDKYFKKFLDFSVYMSNDLKLTQLDYFKRQFEEINFEGEFYKYLFERFESFITHLQIAIKNQSFDEIEDELLDHSTLLTLASFILSSPQFNSFSIKSFLSFFFIYLDLNKHCKSVLSRVYVNEEFLAISMVSFSFLSLVSELMLKFIPRKEIASFLKKYKFTGYSYWYTGLLEFGKQVDKEVELVFEKFENRRKYEIIEKEGLFRVTKIEKYQIKKVYSLFEHNEQEDGIEMLNLFSMENNSPVLNENISTSPML